MNKAGFIAETPASKFMKWFKRIFWSVIVLSILGIIIFFNLEVVQKKVMDVKADAVGSNRSITFYAWNGSEVNTYKDASTRFEIPSTGGISVWLGDSGKKVHSNMQYIIEDEK